MVECYGDQAQGFELRRNGRSLPTRFNQLEHADMAVRLFQKRREREDLAQDYIDEK
jgi:hypothetical protein